MEKILITQNLQLLESTQQALAEMNHLLARLAKQDERVPILMQIPGINVFAALTILAEVGDIARFANAKKLSSYAGSVPSVHRSGQKHSTGRITALAAAAPSPWSAFAKSRSTMSPRSSGVGISTTSLERPKSSCLMRGCGHLDGISCSQPQERNFTRT